MRNPINILNLLKPKAKNRENDVLGKQQTALKIFKNNFFHLFKSACIVENENTVYNLIIFFHPYFYIKKIFFLFCMFIF